MKKLLLATVATIALAAGGAVAAEKPGQAGAKAGAEMKGGAAGQAQTSGSGAMQSGADVKAGAQGRIGAEKGTTGSGAAQSGAGADTKAGGSMRSGAGTTGSAETKGTTQSKSGADTKAGAQTKSGTDTKAGAQTRSGADTKGETTGAASAGAQVTLNAEQKTKIRSTIIESGNAPKVQNVNFSISVGTVVPKTVRVAPLPTTIVEIHPAWRGYRYFVVEERIVIVEPRSLKIVAVLVV